jgi:Ca2+-binding EF-hand superfamily protein
MERKQVQPLMDEFVLAVYMMVQASSEDRARYLFYMIDFDGNGKLEREELQNALELYMKSVSQVCVFVPICSLPLAAPPR